LAKRQPDLSDLVGGGVEQVSKVPLGNDPSADGRNRKAVAQSERQRHLRDDALGRKVAKRAVPVHAHFNGGSAIIGIGTSCHSLPRSAAQQTHGTDGTSMAVP